MCLRLSSLAPALPFRSPPPNLQPVATPGTPGPRGLPLTVSPPWMPTTTTRGGFGLTRSHPEIQQHVFKALARSQCIHRAEVTVQPRLTNLPFNKSSLDCSVLTNPRPLTPSQNHPRAAALSGCYSQGPESTRSQCVVLEASSAGAHKGHAGPSGDPSHVGRKPAALRIRRPLCPKDHFDLEGIKVRFNR